MVVSFFLQKLVAKLWPSIKATRVILEVLGHLMTLYNQTPGKLRAVNARVLEIGSHAFDCNANVNNCQVLPEDFAV